MDDAKKTKAQLICELTALRQRAAELESAVTEREQTEEALRQFETCSQSILDSAILGIVIYQGQDGIILYANLAFAQMFGYPTPDVLRGRYLRDFAAPVVVPELRARIAGMLRGDAIPLHEGWPGIRQDGSTVWVQTLGRVIAWQGQSAVVSFCHDITAQKRAEDRLRESEEQFRDLIEGSIQGIIIHRDLQPLFVNPAYAEVFGYSDPEELLCSENIIEQVIAPHERERMAGYAHARRQGRDAPTYYEYQGVRKEGSVVWVENMVRVVHWGGEPAIQSTIVDITARKRAEEELQQAYQDLVTSQQEIAVAYEELQSTTGELQTVNEEMRWRTSGELQLEKQRLQIATREFQVERQKFEIKKQRLQIENQRFEIKNQRLQIENQGLELANERLRISHNLSETNISLKSLLTHFPVGLVVLDRQFRVLFWSGQAENLWGVRSDAVLGQPFLHLDIGLPVADLKDPLRTCLAREQPRQEVVLEAITRHHKRIKCRVICEPLIDAKRECQGVILLMEEVRANPANT